MDDLNLPDALAAARNTVNDYVLQNDQDHTKRLLLALLDHAPTQQGQWNISRDILECTQQEADGGNNVATKLRELSERYESDLLVPIRVKGGQTPDTSEDSSRQESIEQATLLSMVAVGGEVATRSCDLKKNVRPLNCAVYWTLTYMQALRRDNYRSVLTGAVDFDSITEGLVEQSSNSTAIQAAHILPFLWDLE
ncbi:hypothetical protein RSAG8_09902, partial [Rhizoctonia solani AG-8 WAC10335]